MLNYYNHGLFPLASMPYQYFYSSCIKILLALGYNFMTVFARSMHYNVC